MHLHDVLEQHRDEVMQRWTTRVQGDIVPEAMPEVELHNHLPGFVDEVIAALRQSAGLPAMARPAPTSLTAAGHGEQRLRLGFSLDAVVREYGELRNAILDTAQGHGIELTFAESRQISDITITGIAGAVSEYTRQRDAELHRQHNEHIAFLAHELRNPLASATLGLDSLTQRGHIPGELKASVALRNGLARMQELIDHALQVARTASGVELRRTHSRLRTLLEDAEVVAAGEAEGKEITLLVEVLEDADLHVDLRLIRSALNNLVRNAVRYSCTKGAVTLRGRVTGDRATIEVEDCCGGLDEAQVAEAFAPFVRLGEKSTGFGLGLAIAKQAVDAHGGTMRVQNLPGKGCIFVLELPGATPG